MEQGEIYLADLNPNIGSEQAGVRPVVIISGNSMNANLGMSMICPISTKIKNYSSCVVLKKNSENNLDSDSEIITFQIRTISQKRLKKKIGKISNSQLEGIFKGLINVLKY